MAFQEREVRKRAISSRWCSEKRGRGMHRPWVPRQRRVAKAETCGALPHHHHHQQSKVENTDQDCRLLLKRHKEQSKADAWRKGLVRHTVMGHENCIYPLPVIGNQLLSKLGGICCSHIPDW
ncbi:hypothetical protein GOP47_0015376 [Adiantum capillus-veneris]|uniref:Uncharacterized protein n=1 Tax=Adiantum capillus-veneris TaxID=13818 RepID=A0A9D4UJM9_ADICA|nr:hypothetical protein GOP47_0015376 [Adiantum capillus-veneris]